MQRMQKNKIKMSTRENILEAVLKNQPPSTALPDIGIFKGSYDEAIEKYIEVFKTIGGSAFLVESLHEVENRITRLEHHRAIAPSEMEMLAPGVAIRSLSDADEANVVQA